MPALIPECKRRVDGDGVVILSGPSGVEVRVTAWEARLLPFLESGPDAKAIWGNAEIAGVKLPVEHVQALLTRLQAAGLLVVEPDAAAPADDEAGAGVAKWAALVAQEKAEAEAAAAEAAAEMAASDAPQAEPTAADLDDAWVREEDSQVFAFMRPGPISSKSGTPARARARPQVFVDRTPNPTLPLPSPLPALDEAPGAPVPVAAPAPAPAPAPVPPPSRRGPWLVAVPVLTAGLIIALGVVPWPFGSVVTCVLQPVDRRQITLPIDVRIESITVNDTQHVKPGDVLATLDAAQLTADQAKTLQEIAAVTAELKKGQKEVKSDIQLLRDRVESRSVTIRTAISEFHRTEALFEQGQGTEEEMKVALERVTAAKRGLIDAQVALATAVSGAPDEVQRKNATIARLTATLGQQNELAAQPDVLSPIDGLVTTPGVRSRSGQVLEAGKDLMEIVQLNRMRAVARVPTRRLGKIPVGARVAIHLPGVTKRYEGTLEVVGSSVETEGNERFVRVAAVVDNPELALRPNAEGWLELETEHESILKVLLGRVGISL